MSFWKGLKSVFGFGGDNEEDEEEYDSSLPTYAAQPRIESPKPVTVQPALQAHAHTSETSHQDNTETVKDSTQVHTETQTDDIKDADLPHDLFDAIIEQFNAAQPDFISKCLSTDAQREYLINSLSDSLKRRIHNATNNTEANQKAPMTEHDRLLRRISALEAEVKTTETLRQENRKLHLSVERQKRALLDRINDLEAQVAKNHAEKERFFTDKRNPADAALIDSTNARIKELEQTITERDEKIKELSGSIEKLNATAEELNATIAQRDSQLAEEANIREQLELKNRMSDEMMNDLRNQAAAARNEYEDTCNRQHLALEQIQAQVASFEQVKAKLESRIIELKEALKEEKRAGREEQITRLNEENASLRHTIENNLYNQANSEARLRNEIKQLRRQLEQASSAAASAVIAATSAEPYGDAIPSPAGPTPANLSHQPEEPRPARRRGRPKKVKLDEDLDNTEWFSSQKDNPDFGYHEPPRRPSNDNAAQLSLF